MSDVACDLHILEDDVMHIVRNLRERDRREIFALRWDDDEDNLALTIYAHAGAMWRLWRWQGEPVAMCGIVPQRPGVATAGAFGTDKWPYVLRPMLHWARDWALPRLIVSGHHRIEAYALASNVDGHRFIQMLGGEREAYLREYGRDREDFVLYVRRLNDVL